jgi:hypothetical protein
MMMTDEERRVRIELIGRIEVVPLPSSQWTLPEATEQAIYRWIPGVAALGDVPPYFTVELECSLIANKRRLITPRAGSEDLVVSSYTGGLAVLNAVKPLTAEEQHAYRIMFLMFRRVVNMREHLMRKFQHSRDLYVRRSGRESDDERDVLPPDLGLTEANCGKRWSISDLMQAGEAAAQKFGITRPTSADRIQWGLFESAKRNPLLVQPGQVEGLVRAALFHGGPSDIEIDEELSAELERRVLVAVDSHLDDDNEGFRAWLYGPKNSFVKQIAQQKKAPHGKIPQEVVRKFLLDLGWRAYGYMANCVEAQMWAFWKALPEPLDEQDQQVFDLTFRRQPVFGDLPLIMIAERFPFIRYAMVQLCREPLSCESIGIIHRMLYYYSWMSDERRPADRRAQQATQFRKAEGQSLTINEFEDYRVAERGDQRWNRKPISREDDDI